ncbi:protein SMAX1-LIKE 3-like [Diospyros lotus]|uniref:protein SMAX1-LIKE 3-like n=1 Tax=Diospyros lotus TaxID=55363 RepID=UPI00225C23DF|nr:protein SMAX1-LIKE 3-like [Diospyros lotus]
MRTAGYSVHHTLTTEAATIVKQAISLARRRGHAQVTPLHVAATMLATSAGRLRAACLKAHSHPLQCKALELCFNVALNRLPTSTSSPILAPHYHHHHQQPALSNALVAAFKRAQAHQRRGSVESQQQPILALKVELNQLVVSILDDPSVSRVMREAGFSSTQVKANVEQAVSLEITICSQSTTTPPVSCQSKLDSTEQQQACREDDVMSVINSLLSKKRRNTVIVGESLASAEAVVRGVIDKFERGDVKEDHLRYVPFINLPLFSLKNLGIEEAEQRMRELRCLVKSHVGRGLVLYLGDLNWVSEFWSSYGGHSRNYYCPVELMIMELSRLLSGGEQSGKLWLMGISTFQTYMSCRSGHPCLETLWQLHPLTVPVGSLGLSLNLDSDLRGQFQSKALGDEYSSWSQIKIGVEKNLICCIDCLANFNREARRMAANTCHKESSSTSTGSNLPPWLQLYKEESKRKTINDQELSNLRELCKKWNSTCSSLHKQHHFLEKTLNFSSLSSPSSSTSVSSYDLHQTLTDWPMIFGPKRLPKEHQFLTSDNEAKPDLLSNPNSSPNSASSSEATLNEDDQCFQRFMEHNSENLKVLCNALEKKVPWQKEVVSDIANTILQCRSGMVARKGKRKDHKEETWFFFLGVDYRGKEKIAKELAKLVFGSHGNFVKIGLSSFSSTRADSSEDQEMISNKRSRDESGGYLERFAEAVQANPSRVFFMEDVEQVDYCSQKGIKNTIESGKIELCDGGGLVSLKDAIVIFSCESFSSMSRACSPPSKERDDDDDVSEEKAIQVGSLDLNINANCEEEEDDDDDDSVGEIGFLDSVDRKIIFKIQIL